MKRTRFWIFVLMECVALARPSAAWVQIHVGSKDAIPPIIGFQATSRIPLRFRINDQPPAGITDGSQLAAIRNAFLAWQNVTTATISFIDDGTTSVTNANATDGITLVSFRDSANALPPGAIAVTLSQFDVTTGQVLDSDILFSTTVQFSTTGEASKFDVLTIAIHEVGHLCGLDHILLMSSIMYPFSAPGNQNKVALTQDDVAGVSAIYPTNSFAGSVGTINGTVRLTAGGQNAGVFGGHLVALDSNGRPTVSTVIDSTAGTYSLRGVPPGTYTIYVEPYDGPVSSADLTGGAFQNSFTTNFSTTFLGGVQNPAQATAVTVAAGQTLAGIDINLPTNTTVNLRDVGTAAIGSAVTRANTPTFVQLGAQLTLAVGGSGLAAAAGIQISGSAVTVSNLAIQNNVATMELNVNSSATTGARNIVYLDGTQNSTLSGGLIIGTGAASGGGGGNFPPTLGQFQVGSGDGFIDVEWIDPSGQFTGVIVAVGENRFPALKVEGNQVIVDPASGIEVFRGLNGRRTTLTPVTNNDRRFVTFATFQGTTFSLVSAATTRAVSGGDGINCVESFFGLGPCPAGTSAGGGGGGGGGCFIATAVYGGCQHPEVDYFRSIRDGYLRPGSLGLALVETYSENSPVLAGQVRSRFLARRALQRLLFEPLARSAGATEGRRESGHRGWNRE